MGPASPLAPHGHRRANQISKSSIPERGGSAYFFPNHRLRVPHFCALFPLTYKIPLSYIQTGEEEILITHNNVLLNNKWICGSGVKSLILTMGERSEGGQA